MDTYLVTAENVVLGYGAGERIEPLRAVADCLREHGFPVWPEQEAELFHRRRQTLLIARPAPPRCVRGCPTSLRLRR